MSGFAEGEFTYDDYDDMVRDVRNFTPYLDLSSPTATDRAVDDLSVRDLLEQIRETTDGDLYFNPSSSEPFGDPPVDSPSDTSPGGERPSRSGGCSNTYGSSGRSSRGGLLRVVDVVRVVVLHLEVEVMARRRRVPLPDQQPMHPMQEL